MAKRHFFGGPSTRISIVDGIRSNERDGWSNFVDAYAPLILAFCRRQHLQPSDAEDVVQEVFIAVTKSIHSFDPKRGPFRAWLGKIVERAIIRQQKKRLREGLGQGGDLSDFDDLLLTNDGHEWNDDFDAYVFRFALQRVQESASDRNWHAFEAVWLAEEPVEDVAARMGVKASWVYDNKFQLLKRLSREVKRVTENYAPFQRPQRSSALRAESSTV